MKIIEGTPEEIKEYLNKSTSLDVRVGTIARSPVYNLKEQLKRERHWSSTKHQWVAIKDMDSSYILNTIKKMLRSNPSNEWLLTEDEFKALIVNLGDKIIAEE